MKNLSRPSRSEILRLAKLLRRAKRAARSAISERDAARIERDTSAAEVVELRAEIEQLKDRLSTEEKHYQGAMDDLDEAKRIRDASIPCVQLDEMQKQTELLRSIAENTRRAAEAHPKCARCFDKRNRRPHTCDLECECPHGGRTQINGRCTICGKWYWPVTDDEIDDLLRTEIKNIDSLCECELQNRRWNPSSGNCETCGRTWKRQDRRPSPEQPTPAAVCDECHGSGTVPAGGYYKSTKLCPKCTPAHSTDSDDAMHAAVANAEAMPAAVEPEMEGEPDAPRGKDKQAAAAKKVRDKMQAAGICYICCKNPSGGRARCKECQQRKNKADKLRRERNALGKRFFA